MVEIENLSLSYGNNKKVLKNISLNIKKGECVLFTGKSGSGKSSIINSINGQTPSTTGSVVLKGGSIVTVKGHIAKNGSKQGDFKGLLTATVRNTGKPLRMYLPASCK